MLFSINTYALVVPLFQEQNAARTLPGYDESINHSPAFYVWQNDPGLSSYFTKTFPDGSGVTDLCIPSTLSNILLYQYSQRTPLVSSLKLSGVSSDGKTIDTALLVKGFLEKCDLTNTTKINPLSAAQCVASYYQEAGLSNAKVKVIRNLGTQPVVSGVEYENRAPTIADVHQALKDGYEVSAAIAFMKWDPILKKWIKTSSHAINLFGYSYLNSDEDQKITVYLSNPTRAYNTNYKDPIFEIANLKVNASLEVLPTPYSNVEIETVQGRLLNFEGKSTFLAGLILTKPN